uniref:Uncharacterized protein n=1 Tax=Rhodnius prolixus TaxID=13249 RepID=T1HM27_RHOPR
MSSDAKVGEDAELHEDLLLAKACDSDAAEEDIDDHLNMVQSDLDVLKDILHSEGLSLDASTLMGIDQK